MRGAEEARPDFVDSGLEDGRTPDSLERAKTINVLAKTRSSWQEGERTSALLDTRDRQHTRSSRAIASIERRASSRQTATSTCVCSVRDSAASRSGLTFFSTIAHQVRPRCRASSSRHLAEVDDVAVMCVGRAVVDLLAADVGEDPLGVARVLRDQPVHLGRSEWRRPSCRCRRT